MPGLEFEKPVGADADVSELEYIIALHQTSEQTRANATVSSQDIVALLKSRYGVTVTHNQAIQVVRALGGGDTLVEEESPEPNNVVKDMLDTFKSRFYKRRRRHSRGDDDDGNEEEEEVQDVDDDAPKDESKTNNNNPSASFSASIASTRAAMAKQLQALQGMHSQMQLGKVVPPKQQQSMRNLHQNITDDLRAQVLRKTHELSSRRMAQQKEQEEAKTNSEKPLSVTPKNEQEEQQDEIINVDDNHEEVNIDLSPNYSSYASSGQVIVTKSVSFNNGNKNIDEEEIVGYSLSPDGTAVVSDEEAPAEFLDLVQLLTILLIPIFARLPMDLEAASSDEEKKKEEPASKQEDEQAPSQSATLQPNNTMETGVDGPSDEEPSTQESDSSNNNNKASEPRLLGKIANRFVRYGRHKLGLTDDSAQCQFAARDFMDIGKRALLKSLMPDDDDDDEENEAMSNDDDDSVPNYLDGADPVVDEALVQLLLLSHGEIERANNTKLVKEMVAMAKSESGLLDDEALLNALTSDLGPWDPTCTDVPTTFFYDVFQRAHPSVGTVLRKVDETGRNELVADDNPAKSLTSDVESPSPNDEEIATKKELGFCAKCLKRTFPVIYANRHEQNDFNTFLAGLDLDVDLNSSLLVGILMWFTYLALIFNYGSLGTTATIFERDCPYDSAYWCKIASTIWAWFVIASLLIVYGVWFMVPISIGNNPSDRSVARQVVAGIWVIGNALAPRMTVEWMRRNPDRIEPHVTTHVNGDVFLTMEMIILVFASVLSGVFLIQGFFMLCANLNHPQHIPSFLTPIVSAAAWNGESLVYKATTRKLNRLVANALDLHDSTADSLLSISQGTLSRSGKLALAVAQESNTLHNFVLRGGKHVPAGGLFWTWWKHFDGSLYAEEGLWINSRLWVIQFAQFVLGGFIAAFMFVVAIQSAIAADDFRDSIKDDGLPDWVVDIFPTYDMVFYSLFPAAIVGTVVIGTLCFLYLPSSVTTMLKYRGKLHPSLGSDVFENYRVNLDMTYMNLANAVYGMLGVSGLLYVIVGLLLFLFAWPITREFMLLLTAWGIGLGITIGIKMVVTKSCRKMQYRTYYRIKPAAARISSLALECWYIGLAGSVLIARIGQFLGAAVFWVGRIDSHFLSEEVSLMGYAFDYVPHHFFKDLLIHEAHRHPYIERLAQMYLMRLRHEDSFVSEAGSAWRQLMVLALFPWLEKNRIFADERKKEAMQEAAEMDQKREREAEQFRGFHEMNNGVASVAGKGANEILEIGTEFVGVGKDVVDEVDRTGKGIANLVHPSLKQGAKTQVNRGEKDRANKVVAGMSFEMA